MDATVVIDLRRARRRRRLQKIDISELLYRGYLTALGVGVAVYALSNLPQDRRVTAAQIASVAHHGPALIGVGVAVLVALAVRSGARGGPLVLEAPDIQHVLLSPYSRGRALRQPALQKVRSANPKATMGVVNDVTVDETLVHLGELDFGGKVQCKASVAVWRNRSSGRAAMFRFKLSKPRVEFCLIAAGFLEFAGHALDCFIQAVIVGSENQLEQRAHFLAKPSVHGKPLFENDTPIDGQIFD